MALYDDLIKELKELDAQKVQKSESITINGNAIININLNDSEHTITITIQ